ncbi:MAG TPA: RNA polymerase sigma factor [Chloroflexi bacterium]|jgi:RNA polymerase sigma-70 factor (ECF subfamily)|nr:RNA polymerase sigma factor [Chloroflexota bacterium]
MPAAQPVSKAERDALFVELYNEFHQPIFGYVFRLLRDRERAEDVVQEAFTKAYRALDRLDGDANYRAWLYRIATNTAYDRLRRQRLIAWLPLLESDGEPALRYSQDDDCELNIQVQQVLDQLPIRYRAPLLLYSVAGLSTAEIARVLGISRSGVKMRLLRARRMFIEAHGKGE